MDERLGTLARADADALKAFAESLISDLGDVEVLQSRSGLVMLPMRDTAGGVAFHLGEVLVSEAHIRKGDIDAGFADAELSVEVKEGALIISARKAEDTTERTYLHRLLGQHDGHLSDTAKAAGITRRTLYTKMKAYGLDAADYRTQRRSRST